jgi:hypothetical protein
VRQERVSYAATTGRASKGAMGKASGERKITKKDISKARADMAPLIKTILKHIAEGDAEEKEHSAAALEMIATMDHGTHVELLFKGAVVGPLVSLLKSGSANAQMHAAAALAGIGARNPSHQKAIVEKGGVPPLVALLKTGSAKVQEVAASALAVLDADVAYQAGIIKAGALPALVAVLRSGSSAAHAAAAQATANAAAYSTEAQSAIASADAIPLLLDLLGPGHAQKPAARE